MKKLLFSDRHSAIQSAIVARLRDVDPSTRSGYPAMCRSDQQSHAHRNDL